jgi:hypothetical protein
VKKILVTVAWVLSLGLTPAANAEDNPAAAGFDAAGSDARAVAIADVVMHNLGGRGNWDAVQCLAWEIFGRTHLWNKWTGDYRLEDGELLVIMNVNDGGGRAWTNGVELDGEEKTAALERGLAVWINDSYWVFMPYKLKDTGVTLKYAGESKTPDGRAADVLVLTFRDVGETPENRYEVYVDQATGMVSHWAYFENATDTEPGITSDWNNWTEFGGIMIALRDGRREVKGVRVSRDNDAAAFAGP